MQDALMPTISAPIPVLSEHQILQYYRDLAERGKQGPSSLPQDSSDIYKPVETFETSDEKLELLEVGRRKKFSTSVSKSAEAGAPISATQM